MKHYNDQLDTKQKQNTLLYNLWFSMSSNFLILYFVCHKRIATEGDITQLLILTLLLRMNSGPSDSPRVQQQHRQPQSKYFTLNGILLNNRMFT